MKKLLFYMLAALGSMPTAAQNNAANLKYIETYKEMAIDQMHRHNVPASITLAQGILESAAGQSYLATEANNHFGIKTGSTWSGPWVTKDDDSKQEKFRKYSSPEESFEDHSLFLHKQRYASLFNLDPTDYRGWAYGLKAANYATNPKYPSLLISLIEDYNLAQYDYLDGNVGNTQDGTSIVWVNNIALTSDGEGILTNTTENGEAKYVSTSKGKKYYVITHAPHICNDIVYVLAHENDTYESIAYEMGIAPEKVRKYNEVSSQHTLNKGDIVYLHAKKNHVAYRIRGAYHKIEQGDSMHSIAQRYGIKLTNLYRWNNLQGTYQAKVGDLLRLY